MAATTGGASAGESALRPRDHAGAGRGCLADVALLRAEPGLYGRVASDPTVSRVLDRLGADATRVLAAIGRARGPGQVWQLADESRRTAMRAPVGPSSSTSTSTLVPAHSDKEGAARTFKRGYGHHPLWAFADHGPDGTGEPLAVLLRPGNAGSNTAADHVRVVAEALRQLPGRRRGRSVLVRADAAGCTHEFLRWLTAPGRYSVGFPLPHDAAAAIAKIPPDVWTPAYDADGEVREGPWVAELTGLLDLSVWPKGMRVIVRKERPHPGAQLRLTDCDGHRLTAFAT